MNLGQLHARIASILKRGNTLDDLVPAYVAEAANLIETEHTYFWMKRFGELELPANADSVEFPTKRTKAIELIRVATTFNGSTARSYRPLLPVEPSQVVSRDDGAVSAYWLDGASRIVFDGTFPTATILEMRWHEKTDWPLDLDSEPDLLVRGETALLAQSVMTAALDLRDEARYAAWQAAYQRGIAALQLADEQVTGTMAAGSAMRYVSPD